VSSKIFLPFLRRTSLSVLVGLLFWGIVSASYAIAPTKQSDTYEVPNSTSTSKSTFLTRTRNRLAKVRQRMHNAHEHITNARKIIMAPAQTVVFTPAERVIRKVSKPNPKVRAPQTEAMPLTAPAMPQPPQKMEQPKSGSEKFFSKVADVMTTTWKDNIFVWLPALSTDPNAGATYGILPVLVLADAQKHIRHLMAPSYTYNELFGQTGTMRYYFYPTDSSQLFAITSISQHENREARMRYENAAALDKLLYFRVEGGFQVDASQRFYGIGPNTRESDEGGFTEEEAKFRVASGINFFEHWRTTVGARFRRVSVRDNVIPETNDLRLVHPNLPGLQAENTFAMEYRLLWDTRDSPVTPSYGSSGEFFTEKTFGALGGDADFVRYGVEGKRFFPWSNPKHVSIIRGLYEYANGPNIPFYEYPSIGGRDTLRGYGDSRLADRGRLVFNIEHRITIASLALMGIQTNFEVGPFVDLGTVFPTLPHMQRKDIRPVYGAAFRAAVKPNVVGSVEVGIGKEGPAVFVGINYPF